jgi:hypothetical protein
VDTRVYRAAFIRCSESIHPPGVRWLCTRRVPQIGGSIDSRVFVRIPGEGEWDSGMNVKNVPG